MRSEERRSPSPHLRCVLCNKGDETPITGPLSCKQNIAAHQNCLLFASGIYCKSSPTFDDLFGFDVEDVKNECRRGRKLRCFHCKKNGATAGCEVRSCKRSYHYPCVLKANAIPEENPGKGIFTLYCDKHNPDTSNVEKAKVLPSPSSDTSEHDNSRGGSESDSETPKRRIQNRKRKQLTYFFDSADETQDLIAPVESDLEDNGPQMQNKEPTLDSEDRRRHSKEPRQELAIGGGGGDDDDEAYRDSDCDSQSLLPSEYRQENVQFTVIADSGPSIESVAENSPEPCSPDALREGEAPSSKLDEFSFSPAKVKTKTTVPPNTSVPACPSVNSPPPVTDDESSNVRKEELLLEQECCASLNVPPLQVPDKQPGSHDHPLDLTAPAGCSMAQVHVGHPVGHVDVSDLGASLFWRRCNEMGCTETIFTELTRQLSSLAERVQNQHATQQDYAVSLRILQASGKLPAIYKQLEQDLEDQESRLRKRREALRDAKAVLEENKLI